MDEVSIVIVNWNTKALTRQCLRSLLNQTGVELEIVVVDNGSTDGSLEMLAKEFSRAKVISKSANRGFAVAANQGISASQGRYVLLLNSDTESQANAVSEMVRFMGEHPRVGALGPKLLESDGRLQPSCYRSMGLAKALAIAGGAYENLPISRMLRLRPGNFIRRFFDLPDHDCVQYPDWFRGAVIMFRREAWEQTGGFDEGFFVYYEEIDLLYRLRRAGWKIAYTPQAVFFHHGPGTIPRSNQMLTIAFLRSMLRLGRKHRGPGYVLLLRLMIYLGHCFKVSGWMAETALCRPRAVRKLRQAGALFRWEPVN